MVRRANWRLRVPEWLAPRDDERLIREAERLMAADQHLRSARALRGYRVDARDGSAGRVKDVVIDDQSWSICHVQIDADLLWGRKPVLLLPRWIERVGFEDRTLEVALTRKVIGGAPRFHRLGLVSRLYQMYLYDYYAAASGEPSRRAAPRRRLDMQMMAASLGD